MIRDSVIASLKTMLYFLCAILIVTAICIPALLYYCIRMPGESYSGNLPDADSALLETSQRLSEHVRILAQEIGERHHLRRDALEKAAVYIEEQFRLSRYVPKSQRVSNRGFRNIVVDLYGRTARNKILVIGAHYDTTWMTPGADDNASGVAVLLELAR
jgi:hypothetical protein